MWGEGRSADRLVERLEIADIHGVGHISICPGCGRLPNLLERPFRIGLYSKNALSAVQIHQDGAHFSLKSSKPPCGRSLDGHVSVNATLAARSDSSTVSLLRFARRCDSVRGLMMRSPISRSVPPPLPEGVYRIYREPHVNRHGHIRVRAHYAADGLGSAQLLGGGRRQSERYPSHSPALECCAICLESLGMLRSRRRSVMSPMTARQPFRISVMRFTGTSIRRASSAALTPRASRSSPSVSPEKAELWDGCQHGTPRPSGKWSCRRAFRSAMCRFCSRGLRA